MKITQHGESLFQLTRLWAFNCFLVREQDGFTLIDTNLPGSARGILNAARSLGGEIRRILLTHSHNDHVASLDALHKLLPDATVMIGAREARFLAGERSLDPGEPQARLSGSYTTCATRPDHPLQNGEKIGSLAAVFAPGHTPGQFAFLDERDASLIAGDAFASTLGLAVSGVVRPLFPFPAMATWHKPTALDTARKLVDLQPSRLAVGHGRVIENPIEAMKRAIREAEMKF